MPLSTCSVKILLRRRAESAARKSFRSSARWRSMTRTTREWMNQGGGCQCLGSATPSSNQQHRPQATISSDTPSSFDSKHHLLALVEIYLASPSYLSINLQSILPNIVTRGRCQQMIWPACNRMLIKEYRTTLGCLRDRRLLNYEKKQNIMVVKGCLRDRGLQGSKSAGY